MNTKKIRRFNLLSLAVLIILFAYPLISSVHMADISTTYPDNVDESLIGCYVFDKNIYTNPLSSFLALDGLPYVYGFDEDTFIIADTGGGVIQSYTVEYFRTPVGADEFLSETGRYSSLFSPPDLSGFKERYLLAVMSGNGDPKYSLYCMDGDIWLVEHSGVGIIWSIYRLVKTEDTTLADLERVRGYYSDNPPDEKPDGTVNNQITLIDIYALARKGDELTLRDFDPFYYHPSGQDFTVRRYDVIGADTVFVHVNEGRLETALLWSRRTLDSSRVVDLREGFDAVAKYMNPLNTFRDIKIEYWPVLSSGRELLFDDDYFRSECRYYIDADPAQTYVILEHDERMRVTDALEEARITIEELVANGLYVSMEPKDNPLGGEFTVLHHLHTFTLNGEAFYPSKSFMYVAWDDDLAVYYDIDELAQFLELYGYSDEAEDLLQAVDPADTVTIARGRYVTEAVLAGAGIESAVGWAVSSHTPVWFSVG